MNVSFVIYFWLGKYNFNLDIFWTQLGIYLKINVYFIDHLCLGQYSFSFDTFWTHFVILKKKLMFSSLFIFVSVNTASMSILFKTLVFRNILNNTHSFFLFAWQVLGGFFGGGIYLSISKSWFLQIQTSKLLIMDWNPSSIIYDRLCKEIFHSSM